MDRDIAKIKADGLKARISDEQFELERRLSDLLCEEKRLQAERRTKLEEKKDKLKAETKKQLAQMNAQKKLIEADIQAFQEAIAQLRSLGTERTVIPEFADTCSDEDPREVNSRFADVRRDVRRLELKCRTLQEFVGLHSPDRYDRIMLEKRRIE
jgi:chromosome segregation ATPase